MNIYYYFECEMMENSLYMTIKNESQAWVRVWNVFYFPMWLILMVSSTLHNVPKFRDVCIFFGFEVEKYWEQLLNYLCSVEFVFGEEIERKMDQPHVSPSHNRNK